MFDTKYLLLAFILSAESRNVSSIISVLSLSPAAVTEWVGDVI